jgi:hypothetical protein
MKLYFRDNFFNSGLTEILTESNEMAGELDLKSAFGSSLHLYGVDGVLKYSGSFPIFSNKWEVFGADGEEVGVLRHRIAFFSKLFEYDAGERGCYEITSPAFSREYEINDEAGTLVASFERVSGWFSADAYCLENHSDLLNSYELVTVVMGMHEIQKRIKR